MYPLFVAPRKVTVLLPVPCRSEHTRLPVDVLAVGPVTETKRYSPYESLMALWNYRDDLSLYNEG